MKRILLFLSPFYVSATAMAQDGIVPTPQPSDKVDFFEILQQGGVMMIPLAILSIVAICLVFFYMIVIRKGSVVNDRFMNQAENLILQGDYYNLSEMCERNSSAISHILGRAVDFHRGTPTASLSDIREIAEAEGSRQSGILSQRITYLADVGAIAPMAGLLGTVIGMIKSFREISFGNFEGVKQMQLSSGVSEALITTASGLVIGLVAIIFYSYFRGKVQHYINELEAAATHLMAVLSSVNTTNKTYLERRTVPAQDVPTELPPRRVQQELPPRD